MIRPVRWWLSERTLVIVADSPSAGWDVLACAAQLIEPVAIVTRVRVDPAPVRTPGTTGPTRSLLAQLPTLAKRLADPGPIWQRIPVPWSGGHTHCRTGERHRCLVSQRAATGGDPLGASSGPAGAVRSPCPSVSRSAG
jgi:hypothetical protein